MSTLVEERAEAKKRIKALKKETKNEQLKKEVLGLEHELTEMRRPSIFQWFVGLFLKGGK